MLGKPWLAEELSATQEGPYSIELVSSFFSRTFQRHSVHNRNRDLKVSTEGKAGRRLNTASGEDKFRHPIS